MEERPMAKYEVTVCDNDGKSMETITVNNVNGPAVEGAPNATLVVFHILGMGPNDPPAAAFRYQAVRSIVLKP
jgi:hypothetical protein